jgi:hypothetical protein
MTATIVPRKVKNRILKQLDAAQAGTPPPTDEQLKGHAALLYESHAAKLSMGDRMFVAAACSQPEPFNSQDRQRLILLITRRIKANKAAAHPATTGTTTPAGIAANDASATGFNDDAGPASGSAAGGNAVPGNGHASQVVKIALEVLVRHPVNRHPTKESIAARAESMKTGQLEPILVRQLPQGQRPYPPYQVLSGETRWLAAKQLGWTHIEARVREMRRRRGPGARRRGQRPADRPEPDRPRQADRAALQTG